SRRHTRFSRDWSSDVCSSDLVLISCQLCEPCKIAVDCLLEEILRTALLHSPVVVKVFIDLCKIDLRMSHGRYVQRYEHLPQVMRSEERRVGKAATSRS